MQDLHRLNPDEVLAEDFHREYSAGMQFFHLQLVHLNANIFILDHVLAFPFRILVPAGRSLFFRFVFENAFYASLLVITRLAADQGPEYFTLPRFKNKVRQAVKEPYRQALDDLLRKARFGKQLRSMLQKTGTLRSLRVAHSAEDFVLGNVEEPLVKFGELKNLRDHLVELFDALTFNVDHLMYPIEYSARVQPRQAVDPRSDIEELLGLIADNSPALRLPEKHPDRWIAQRATYLERELLAFNEYRQKFGLPEA